MSTILKALRRLEQERAKGVPRPLRDDVVLSRPSRRGAGATWALTGLALLLGFAATWGVLAGLGGGEPEPTPPVSAPAPLTAAAEAAAPPAPAMGATAPPVVRVAPPAATTTAPRPPPLPAPRTVARPPAAPAPVHAPLPVAAPRPAPERVASASAPRPAPAPAPGADRLARDPLLTRPITGRAPRLVDEPDEPPRSAAVLPVQVVRTTWHPQPDRRAAWVALGSEAEREVREGEWVGAYEVRAIEPDGVLFADGPLLVHRGVGER